MPAQTSFKSAVGILATSLDGIELMFRSIQSTQPWLRDPVVAPIPFRQDVFEQFRSRGGSNGVAKDRPLKFGFVEHDNVQVLHPPVKRALELAVKAVQAAGHKLIAWKPPPHSEALQIINSFFAADGAKDVHDQLNRSGEPLLESLKPFHLPHKPASLEMYNQRTLQGIEFQERYADYWNSTGQDDGQVVDAILSPVAPHAAVVPGKYYSTSYTMAYNMLNYSAVVIPVTKADKELDKRTKEYNSYKPISDTDRKNWEAYDAEVHHGAPVGVQIVGRKYEEEKVLAIAMIVDEAVKKYLGVQRSHGQEGMSSKPLSAVL